jgi:hypothetical protein
VLENGALVARNIPVPPLAEALPFEPIVNALSYSHVIDRLMARVDPGGWYSRHRRIQNDPVDISCRLLKRLKQETDDLGIRTLLVTEISAQDVMAADVPPPRLAMVEKCAQAIGYQIVDTFGAFRAAYKADPTRLQEFYEAPKGIPRHFSELGNRRVAETVAAALADEPMLAGRP